MFDTEAFFAGISLHVDPINRSRTENDDNVMAMFYEEQPFMWEYVKSEIQRCLHEVKGKVDFLDVGTGSGVWSILVAKHFNAEKIVAIDKSARAIMQARHNSQVNLVEVNFQEEFYNMSSVGYKEAKCIGVYPPYHLYPKELEMKIPQHARGGVDGQQAFKEQLLIANYHLADGGSIVFNQMCLGRDGQPDFTRYIPHLLDGVSLRYINIFTPIDTASFLYGVYGAEFEKYQNIVSKVFPELYYCDGIITRDGKGKVIVEQHNIDLKSRTWKDRVELHRQIALHGLNDL